MNLFKVVFASIIGAAIALFATVLLISSFVDRQIASRRRRLTTLWPPIVHRSRCEQSGTAELRAPHSGLNHRNERVQQISKWLFRNAYRVNILVTAPSVPIPASSRHSWRGAPARVRADCRFERSPTRSEMSFDLRGLG